MSKFNDKFWNKVEQCKHKNLSPNYLVNIYCETPYCDGRETHCLDCGVFLSSCGCGYCNGTSGWSEARWKKLRRKLTLSGKKEARK